MLLSVSLLEMVFEFGSVQYIDYCPFSSQFQLGKQIFGFQFLEMIKCAE